MPPNSYVAFLRGINVGGNMLIKVLTTRTWNTVQKIGKLLEA